jgi:hypothetical protein
MRSSLGKGFLLLFNGDGDVFKSSIEQMAARLPWADSSRAREFRYFSATKKSDSICPLSVICSTPMIQFATKEGPLPSAEYSMV